MNGDPHVSCTLSNCDCDKPKPMNDHAAGRRAGLEEVAVECQQRQEFCQAVLDTADHRNMAPGELQGWHWKKDLLAALAEWCRAKAKEGT